MSYVFVVDTNRQPLNPVHPGRARLLLKEGKAAVLRRFPFTILLKSAVEQPTLTPLRLKIDPGTQTTGFALLNDTTGEVVWASELSHRGFAIKATLDVRRAVRRSRRQRKTRYRAPRFANRRNKKPGWLPPSLVSRISNIETWVKRLMLLCPITAISQELVKFDLQRMENPEIQGAEYQQGTLFGYEVREYVLLKWQRRCSYCGAENVPLQVEHIHPRAKGGSDRVSNLCLACQPCNDKKGTRDIRDFLAKQPERLAKILAQAKAPLRDATAVNASRWLLYTRLKAVGLPLETGSGGLTRFNRQSRGLPKTHWLDAACVGTSTPEAITAKGVKPLLIRATGHGSRQMCRMDRFGFPRTSAKEHRRVQGFQTGDLVRAVVPSGKKAGVHVGRVAIRSTGYFNITTKAGTIQGVAARFCHAIHRGDGYAYF